MANAGSTTGICLHALPPREEAVLKRVISFSSTQGRNYVLADSQTADMLVVSDDISVDPALMNPAGCLLVRIADAGTAQDYDVLMQRPLLVTKVMRTLDQAKAMLSAGKANETRENVTAEKPVVAPSPEALSVQPVASVQAVEPTPATHLVESTAPTDTQSSLAATETASPVADAEVVQPVAPAVAESSPKPAMSLYAQILGGSAAKSSSVQSESKSVQEPEASASAPVAEPVPAQRPELVESVQTSDSSGNDVVAPPESAADVTSAKNNTVRPQGMHHLALVVDDSAAIRKQLELELRAAGIGAEFAETGEEALEKVAANRYDLIFLDIIMPGIDGYETCRQMRLRAELKKTPVIMLSAKTSPLDEVQGVIAGASTYLTKPVKSDQLQQTLKRVSMWLDNFQGLNS